MLGRNASLLPCSPNEVFNDFRTQRSLQFQLLVNCRQGWIVKSCTWNVVEAHHRNIFGDLQSSLGEGSDSGTGTEIVESNQASELGWLTKKFLGQIVSFDES